MRGFTLIEIVIAIGFLAALIIPIASLVSLHDRESRNQNQHIASLLAASSTLEELNSVAFTDKINQTITYNNNIIVTVKVSYIPTPDILARDLTSTDSTTNFKEIMVTAKAPEAPPVKLVRIFANFYNP